MSSKLIICKNCGKEKPHAAKGLCLSCYQKRKINSVKITCKGCGKLTAHYAKGYCKNCYSRYRLNGTGKYQKDILKERYEGTVVSGWIISNFKNYSDYDVECLDCGKAKHMAVDIRKLLPHKYCPKLYRPATNDRTKTIMAKLFEYESLTKVAEEFGVTKSRIGQIADRYRDKRIFK